MGLFLFLFLFTLMCGLAVEGDVPQKAAVFSEQAEDLELIHSDSESDTMKFLHKRVKRGASDELCYGHKCIKIFHNEKQWEDAKRSCHDRHMRLVKITDEGYNHFILEAIQEDMHHEYGSNWRRKYEWKHNDVSYWIGLKQERNGHAYFWTDRSRADYFNWKDGEQYDHKGVDNQRCIRIVAKDGRWGDHVCRKRYKYICEKY